LSEWWARQGSNLHGLLHRILSPARLPIPPRAHKQLGEPTAKGESGKASIGQTRAVQWGMNQGEVVPEGRTVEEEQAMIGKEQSRDGKLLGPVWFNGCVG